MRKRVVLALVLIGMVIGIPAQAGVDYYQTTALEFIWPEFTGPAGVEATYTVVQRIVGSADSTIVATMPHIGDGRDYVVPYDIDFDHTWKIQVWGRDEFNRVATCSDTVAFLKEWGCPGPCYSRPRTNP
jgi:hypothetical protein